VELREVAPQGGDLVELGGVLGEDDLCLRVAEDEGDVVGDGGGVDGDGGGGGVHDPVVRQDPLVAGRRGDGDALFGVHAEGHEPGADLGGLTAQFRPGDGLPAVVGERVAEGAPVGGEGDAPAQHVAHGGDVGVEGDGGHGVLLICAISPTIAKSDVVRITVEFRFTDASRRGWCRRAAARRATMVLHGEQRHHHRRHHRHRHRHDPREGGAYRPRPSPGAQRAEPRDDRRDRRRVRPLPPRRRQHR
jgi:hypothetical protein